MSSSRYPINGKHCETISLNVRALRKAFVNDYHRRVKLSVKFAAPRPIKRQCYELFGDRVCKHHVSNVAIAEQMLQTVLSVRYDVRPSNDLTIVKYMPLYVFQEQHSGAGPSTLADWIGLRVFSLSGSAISVCFPMGFVEGSPMCVVGSIVKLDLSMRGLVADGELDRRN